MTAVVTAVTPKGDKGAALMTMSEGKPVWTPNMEAAAKLIGSPIPADWTQKDGEYGPQAFPPKPKGGGFGGAAAFRNSKEGQAYEQERMDRRTALMQAVASGASEPNFYVIADSYYEWLRLTTLPVKAAGGGASAGTQVPLADGSASRDGKPAPEPTSPSPTTSAATAVEKSGVRGDAEGAQGVIPGEEAAPCAHTLYVQTKPDGSPLPKGFVRCESCGTVFKP